MKLSVFGRGDSVSYKKEFVEVTTTVKDFESMDGIKEALK